MPFLLILPALLSFLLLAAHFLRAQSPLFTLASLAFCALLLVPRRWVLRLAQLSLVLASLEWLYTTLAIIQMRRLAEEPFIRAAIILLAVAGFNLLAAALFQTPWLLRRYRDGAAPTPSPHAPTPPPHP